MSVSDMKMSVIGDYSCDLLVATVNYLLLNDVSAG